MATTPATRRTACVDLVLHEALGGHTIERHVGKSGHWLMQRLQGDPTIQAATAFANLVIAQQAVNAAVAAGEDRLTEWLRSTRKIERLDHEMGTEIGFGLRRISPLGVVEVSHPTAIRVILERTGRDAEVPFLVLTAFPAA